MKNLKPVSCLAVFGACLLPQLAHTARADEAAVVDFPSPKVVRPRLFSLDFTKASVVDVLQIVAKEADIDVIISEGVSGTLPRIVLKDVTAKQAIQTIARMAKLSFFQLDSQTFVVAVDKSKARAELSEPRVNISRTVKLSIDVRATSAKVVLQQIADQAGFKLVFLDSPDFVISRLQMSNVTPEAAIQWVATMSKFNAIAIMFKEGGKDVPGFLIRSNQPHVPAPSISILQSPRDKAQEVVPMLVTPPRDRIYSGLLPMPKSVPLPETNGSIKPQNDFLRDVPQDNIPQNAAPQK